MDEERGKKPSAIGRFDERRIKLIYCDCTFLPSLDCWNLLYLQSVYHNQCNIHILLHCLYMHAYSCSQHSPNPCLRLVVFVFIAITINNMSTSQ